jgi:hypothetical protein
VLGHALGVEYDVVGVVSARSGAEIAGSLLVKRDLPALIQ